MSKRSKVGGREKAQLCKFLLVQNNQSEKNISDVKREREPYDVSADVRFCRASYL